jgi:prolyl oligopeptidase
MTRDWGPGTTTDSGYGMVIKTLKRGQALERGRRGVPRPEERRLGAAQRAARRGRQSGGADERATDFFHDETYLWDGKVSACPCRKSWACAA